MFHIKPFMTSCIVAWYLIFTSLSFTDEYTTIVNILILINSFTSAFSGPREIY